MSIKEEVTDKWIRWKLTSTGLKIKHIVEDTGLNKTSLSAWINGQKPLSLNVQIMFYYYFLSEPWQRLSVKKKMDRRTQMQTI